LAGELTEHSMAGTTRQAPAPGMMGQRSQSQFPRNTIKNRLWPIPFFGAHSSLSPYAQLVTDSELEVVLHFQNP
jgi:hypothetical protein